MFTVYLSGPITGCPDYQEKFAKAEKIIQNSMPSARIINPAKVAASLPSGLSHGEYMRVDFALLGLANAIVLLPGWEDSEGCKAEISYAKAAVGLKTLFKYDSVKWDSEKEDEDEANEAASPWITDRVPDKEDYFVLVQLSGRFQDIVFEHSYEIATYSAADGWIVEAYPEWDDPTIEAWMWIPDTYTGKEIPAWKK